MTIIKPISDLRNDFASISEICHSQDEPVYLTRNGRGDLVVMSLTHYEKMESMTNLYHKLDLAEKQSKEDPERVSHDKVMKRLMDRYHE